MSRLILDTPSPNLHQLPFTLERKKGFRLPLIMIFKVAFLPFLIPIPCAKVHHPFASLGLCCTRSWNHLWATWHSQAEDSTVHFLARKKLGSQTHATDQASGIFLVPAPLHAEWTAALEVSNPWPFLLSIDVS